MATATKTLIDAIWHIDQAIGCVTIIGDIAFHNIALTQKKRNELVKLFYSVQVQLTKQAKRLEKKQIRRLSL